MKDLESRQREREAYHGLRVLPGAWPVVRVDGRSFTRFTGTRFSKPFDASFSAHMVETARALMTELQAVYAYTESDEISVLLPRSTDLFDRSVEKLVSISAGVASATFSMACGDRAHFDSRLWVGPADDDVVDYFVWRQADAFRCGLNGWAYWTLRESGLDAAATTKRLHGMRTAEKNELLFSFGINVNDLPAWQRRGTGLSWETYDRPATDPRTGSEVVAVRRRIAVDRDLPSGDAYASLVRGFLG